MNLITFRYWDSFIPGLKARPLDITVSNHVDEHDVSGRHHLQRVGGGPLTTLPVGGEVVARLCTITESEKGVLENFVCVCVANTTMKRKLNV